MDSQNTTIEVTIEHKNLGTEHRLVVQVPSTLWRRDYKLGNSSLMMIREHGGDHLLDPNIAEGRGIAKLVQDVRGYLDDQALLPRVFVTAPSMARDFEPDVEAVPASFLIALRNAVHASAIKAAQVEIPAVA